MLIILESDLWIFLCAFYFLIKGERRIWSEERPEYESNLFLI